MSSRPNAYELDPFFVYQVDYRRQLHEACPDGNWQDALVELALRESVKQPVSTKVEGSCEDPDNPSTEFIYTVPTKIIYQELGWFIKLMQEDMLPLARRIVDDDSLVLARQPQNFMNLNLLYSEPVMVGSEERKPDGYDGHIDFTEATAIIQGTDHPPGTGGELRVATNPSARTAAEIDERYRTISQVAGTLTIINGHLPHRVTRPLNSHRVTAVVCMYGPNYSEDARPDDVSRYSEGLDPFPESNV